MSEICVSVEHIFIILWFDWEQFLLEVRRCDYFQQTRSLGGNQHQSQLFIFVSLSLFCSAELGVQSSSDKLSVSEGLIEIEAAVGFIKLLFLL